MPHFIGIPETRVDIPIQRMAIMKSFSFSLLIMFAAVTCSSEKMDSTAGLPFFRQEWNRTFHLRTTETGEVISIGAVFSDGMRIYVYDLAQGSVITLDSTGGVADSVRLESIGRNSYAGDDLVAMDSVFIFLNGVDRRLEFFDRTTGKHLKSVPLPADLMSGAKKRSHRVVNRLFLEGETLLVGNEYRLVPFDPSLGKRIHGKTVLTAAASERLIYMGNRVIVERSGKLIDRLQGAEYLVPSTHFPVPGKRFFMLGSRIFALDAGKDSLMIAEMR